MKLGRHGIVAAILGVLMSLGLHSIPVEGECPEADCPFSAPTGVRAIDSTPTELRVAWKDVPNASAYRIQIARQNNFLDDDVISLTKAGASASKPLVIPDLDPGTKFQVRVSVIDRARRQQSEWSMPAPAMTKGPMRLSVGTFNIRNPDSSWSTRGPFVADHIVSQKLQVLGVQEVYRPNERRSLLHYVNTRSRQLNGRPIYGMAPEPSSGVGYDNRILYDVGRLKLIQAGGKRYEYQAGDGEVDRWFAWATFQHRASGWRFLFVTTHLQPDNDYADLQQWRELVREVNALKKATQVKWVVVAGDFNTTKLEKPADVMLPAMRQNGYGDVLGQEYGTYGTTDARAEVKKDAHLRSFNGFRRDIEDYSRDDDENGNGVDWIFASNDLAVPYYRVYARYDDDGRLAKPIPSDHFLIYAIVAYDPPTRTVNVAETVAPSSAN